MILNSHSYYINGALPLASKILDHNEWDIIHTVSQLGEGPNYWSVGDYKTFTGRSGTQYAATIVGFNQETSLFIPGGSGGITFALSVPGTGVPKLFPGASIEATTFSSGGPTGPSSTKWTNSAYYKTGGLLATISSDLPLLLNIVRISVDKKYAEVNSNGSYTSQGSFGLFVPSRTEIFGSSSDQYQYWANGGTVPTGDFWLRDAYSYSWYDGTNGVRGIYKFYISKNGSVTNDGYTDKWNYAGSTGRTGTTTANIMVMFVL